MIHNAFDREYFDNGGTNQRFKPGPERSVMIGIEAEF
jgi:hypothetical protein